MEGGADTGAGGRGGNLPTVAVVMGGTSSEREISIRSGQAVVKALARAGYPVAEVVINEDSIRRLEGLKFDVVFVALHGAVGEDGRIQELLEARSITYTGSGPEASRLAMDKIASKDIFRSRGIPTPPDAVLSCGASEKEVKKAARKLGLPVVIKPACEGSSIGVHIVREASALADAFADASALGEKVLMEKFVGDREFTVGVLDDMPLPVIELVTSRQFFDYEAKYEDGYTQYLFDFELPERERGALQRFALEAHRALGCRDFSRVDLRLAAPSDIYVLEVNSIPGLTGHSLVPKAAARAGIPFAELVVKLVGLALARKRVVKP
jgi:D-alanine-D-alanine ligase